VLGLFLATKSVWLLAAVLSTSFSTLVLYSPFSLSLSLILPIFLPCFVLSFFPRFSAFQGGLKIKPYDQNGTGNINGIFCNLTCNLVLYVRAFWRQSQTVLTYLVLTFIIFVFYEQTTEVHIY